MSRTALASVRIFSFSAFGIRVLLFSNGMRRAKPSFNSLGFGALANWEPEVFATGAILATFGAVGGDFNNFGAEIAGLFTAGGGGTIALVTFVTGDGVGDGGAGTSFPAELVDVLGGCLKLLLGFSKILFVGLTNIFFGSLVPLLELLNGINDFIRILFFGETWSVESGGREGGVARFRSPRKSPPTSESMLRSTITFDVVWAMVGELYPRPRIMATPPHKHFMIQNLFFRLGLNQFKNIFAN